jgi:hypothetical protein
VFDTPAALGPAPFLFAPHNDPLRVRAFSVPFRVLATLFVFGIAAWMLVLWRNGQLTPAGLSTAAALGWPLAALAVLLYTWWQIITSHTTLTAEKLHQSWIWDKHMELRELAYGKLIRVPGLDWLIAPRLYVRTLMGKFAVFYAADAAMIAEFERLVAELRAFREDVQ